jgi:hypothetical protein
VSWQSTVPAALAGLVAAFRASPDLASPVDVRDGPVVTSSSARDVVVVGWNGQENDELAVEGQDIPEGLAASPDREAYSIRCAAISVCATGSAAAAIVTARTRAYELVAACGAAIAADRRLGGTVMRATMGASSLRQVPDQNGLVATVEFAVDIDAYSGR